MNVRNVFSNSNGVTLSPRSSIRTRRQRNTSSAAPTRTWFPSANATPDSELREVVAQRFMSMNEAHDRIRTKLLASRAVETSYALK